MPDSTHWTPSAEDNLLHLTDKHAINEQEAKGIAMAELYVLGLDTTTSISTSLILDLHKLLSDIFTIGQVNGALQIYWLDNLNHRNPGRLFNSCISSLII